MSNTHSFIDGNTPIGISTAMRVRQDEFFAPIIAAHGLSPSVKSGEYVVDPRSDLGWSAAESAPVRSVCLLDYGDSTRTEIREIERDIVFDYLEHFGLAINVYGLKEDMLDHQGRDVWMFSTQMSRTRAQLRAPIDALLLCELRRSECAEPASAPQFVECSVGSLDDSFLVLDSSGACRLFQSSLARLYVLRHLFDRGALKHVGNR